MSQEPYDPQAPESGSSSGNAYLSFKDLRVLGLIMLVLLACLYPIYLYGKRKSEKAQCVNNIKAMSDALGLYAKDHDDGLPPVYRSDDQGMPSLGDAGLPYTWASDLSGYMNPRASFKCPSASEDEIAYVEDPTSGKKKIAVTYGFYYPYGGVKMFNIENIDSTVLITETSNNGSNETFNPKPLTDAAGKILPDAFVIGWNDSNLVPTKNSTVVTRLAFRGLKDRNYTTATARHDEGNNALLASGAKMAMNASESRIRQSSGLPGGMWAVPASAVR